MADPNRSAAFLHPLQEDSCLAAVGKDLGAGKLALGYSLFTVVRAHLMKARDRFNVSLFDSPAFNLLHILLINPGIPRFRDFQYYVYFEFHGVNEIGHKLKIRD
jgi:hypothetical protein